MSVFRVGNLVYPLLPLFNTTTTIILGTVDGTGASGNRRGCARSGTIITNMCSTVTSSSAILARLGVDV